MEDLEERISREESLLEAVFNRIRPIVDNFRTEDMAIVRALLVYKLALYGPNPEQSELLTRISLYSGVPIEDLKGERRFSNLAKTRQIAYHAYRRMGLSFPEIARRLGGLNHTTVLGGCRRVDGYIKHYKDLVNAAFLGRELTDKEIKALKQKYVKGKNSSDPFL